MSKITISACDECGTTEKVALYTIEGDGGVARVDLCEEHAQPLRTIMDEYGILPNAAPLLPTRGRSKTKASPKFDSFVSTMEDIEKKIIDFS